MLNVLWSVSVCVLNTLVSPANSWTSWDAFGDQTHAGTSNRLLDEGAQWQTGQCALDFSATWRMQLSSSCTVAMQPYVRLIWPLVFIYSCITMITPVALYPDPGKPQSATSTFVFFLSTFSRRELFGMSGTCSYRPDALPVACLTMSVH